MVQAMTEGRPALQGNPMRIEGRARAQILSSKTMGGKKGGGAENVQPNGKYELSNNMYQGAEEGNGGHTKPEGAINLRMR